MTVAEQIEAERGVSDTLDGYAGRWVAMRDYEVVASAGTLEELLGEIEGQSENVTVLRVAEEDSVACFF